nr:apolipoprotein N-acyltransferase [Bacteroidota bacterium]
MKKKHLYILAALSGILLSLGWPMNGFPWLLFIGFVPLLLVEDHLDNHRNIFHKYAILKFSYIAFLVWTSFTTWWIWNSTIFGGIMGVFLNASFMTIAFLIFHLSKRSFFNNRNTIYLFVIYWISFEYLHLDWDLSFPWLNLGNGFAMYPKWIQWYEYTGTLGGTLWILLVNVMVFRLIKIYMDKVQSRILLFRGSIILLCILIPMSISWIIYERYEEQGE